MNCDPDGIVDAAACGFADTVRLDSRSGNVRSFGVPHDVIAKAIVSTKSIRQTVISPIAFETLHGL